MGLARERKHTERHPEALLCGAHGFEVAVEVELLLRL